MQLPKLILILSRADRALVLAHGQPRSEISQKLLFAPSDGTRVLAEMDWDDVVELAECAARQAKGSPHRKSREQLSRLRDRLDEVLRKGLHQMADSLSPNLPASIRDAAKRILLSGKVRSTKDIDAALNGLIDDFNNRPMKELQGLSRVQLNGLTVTFWGTPDAAIHFREDLTYEEASASEFYRNAIVLMGLLEREGGAKTTAKLGNLNRKFVVKMLESMELPPGYREHLERFNKAINEEDVSRLISLRLVVQSAKLIRKHKGQFIVPKSARRMMEPHTAGAMYAALFRTYFLRYNIAYTDGMPECPDVQHSIGYVLYVIGQAARNWVSVSDLAEIAFTPDVAAQIGEGEYWNRRESMLSIRILPILERFALIECERKSDDDWIFGEIGRIRTTPLFHRFLTFSFDE